ncbi:MAG TPA: PAS domain S-box protein [Acidobacteriota bacterium]
MTEITGLKKRVTYFRISPGPTMRLPLLSLVLSLLVTAWFTYGAHSDVQRSKQFRFEKLVAELKQSIDQRLMVYAEILRGAQGLFAASNSVERDEWAQYLNVLGLNQRYPGLAEVGFVSRVPERELQAFEKAARNPDRSGVSPDFTVRPKGNRAEYFPIKYVEPFTANKILLGFDIASEPTRRAAAERARDAGSPIISGGINLVQDPQRARAFLMFYPIYRKDAPHSNVMERRAALEGWAYVAIKANDLMETLIQDGQPEVDFEIFDQPVISRDHLLYDSDTVLHAIDSDYKPTLKATALLNVFGRSWIIYCTTRPQFDAINRNRQPVVVLIIGAMMSVLIFGIVWSLTTTQARALASADEMTRAFRESEERTRAVMDHVSNGIITYDQKGTVETANKSAEHIFGWPAHEIVGKKVSSLLVGFSAQPAKGTPSEYYGNRADGSAFVADVTVSQMRHDHRNTFIAIVRDITQRKHAEDLLRESEERNRTLLASLPQRVFFKDKQSVFVSANEAFARDLGKKPEEVIGKTDFDLFRTDVAERYRSDDLRIMSTRRPETIEESSVFQGQSRYLEIVKAPVISDDGEVLGVLGLYTDITERKGQEAELAEQRYLMDTLMENAPDKIYFKDSESRFLRVSKALANAFGLKHPSEALGKTDYDFFAVEYAHAVFRNEQEIIKTGRPMIGVTEREIWANGQVTWAMTTRMAMRDQDGRIIGTFGLSRDITASKRAEGALRESEERNRTLLASLPQRIFFKDRNSRFVSVNDAFARDLGMSPADIIGKTDYDFAPRELADKYRADDMRVMNTRRSETIEEKNVSQGTERFVEVIKAPVVRDNSEVMGVLGLFSDITQRKSAEEALKSSEARTRSIIENMLESLITVNESGIIESVNPASEQMFGYRQQELVGQQLSRLIVLPPGVESQEFIKNVMQKALGRISEWEARRKNQQTFPIELVLSEFHIREGRRFVANIRDVSERREVDRLKREFVSTVSHELRTPLTSIRGSLSLLAGGALGQLPDEANEVVALAERNTIRLITLINDILDLERLESGKLEMHFETLAIESILKRSVEAVHAFGGQEGITIQTKAAATKVFADGDRLVQVLVNLLSNAVKFSPRGSVVDITAQETSGWVEVSVIDHGRGIPATHRRVIFERFRQVEAGDSRQKGGTGLGLAICKAIIEQHGGTIGVESEEGKGSRFWFRIPSIVKRKEIAPKTGSDGHDKLPILIGDSDPEMRRYLEQIVRREGLGVVVGSSASETWSILKQNVISMAILDTVLLNHSESELVEKLQNDPKLKRIPIIVVGENVLLSPERFSDNLAVFLPKPLNEAELLAAIRETLKKAGRSDVLLVEDDENLLEIMVRQLGRDGISVRTAVTGKEAIRLAQEKFPGLMVLDVGLPEGDGFDVVDALRHDSHLKKIPLLVYTGRDLTAEQRGQLTLGATRFLTKSEATDQEFQDLVFKLLHRSIESGSQV